MRFTVLALGLEVAARVRCRALKGPVVVSSSLVQGAGCVGTRMLIGRARDSIENGPCKGWWKGQWSTQRAGPRVTTGNAKGGRQSLEVCKAAPIWTDDDWCLKDRRDICTLSMLMQLTHKTCLVQLVACERRVARAVVWAGPCRNYQRPSKLGQSRSLSRELSGNKLKFNWILFQQSKICVWAHADL